MSFSSSSASPRSNDGVSDQFPAGLRVLVVDDDSTCLMILEKMLRKCLYDVTTCNRAETALQLLRENKNAFDIVISDVHMPDMDGFKLLEYVELEMNLPVIMMSVDDNQKVVMKGVTHGACDYLIKPVRMSALKNIWQHVFRKNNCEQKEKNLEPSVQGGNGEQQQKAPEEAEPCSPSANVGDWRSSKKIKTDEAEPRTEEKEDASMLRKPRVVWTPELHQQFVAAVTLLQIDKAVPKKILELMNVPELTRENVASHLQKYRLFLKKGCPVPLHQDGPGNQFLGTMDAAFVELCSHNGLDLDALAVPGQVPQHPLTGMQGMPLGRPCKNPTFSFPPNDQPNIFCMKNRKLRFLEGQQQRNDSGKQVNFIYEIPTNVASKQLASRQSAPAFGNMHSRLHFPVNQNKSLPQQMVQQRVRTHLPNGTNIDRHVMNHPSVGPTVLFGQNGIKNLCETEHTLRANADLSGTPTIDNLSFLSNLGTPTLTSKPIMQEQVNSEMKIPRFYSSDQNHNRNDDWVQGGLDVFLQPGFPAVKKEAFSVTNELGNAPNISGLAYLSLAHDNSAIKNEQLPDTDFLNTLFLESLVQEDLTTNGKQGPVEPGFDFK